MHRADPARRPTLAVLALPDPSTSIRDSECLKYRRPAQAALPNDTARR